MIALLTLIALQQAPLDPARLLTERDRREHVQQLSRADLERFLTGARPAALLALSLQAIHALGPYEYVMQKQERIKGTLQDVQTIRTIIREEPNAIRLEYLKGPSAGRKLIYNAAVKKKEFRVREPGLLSVIGRLWIPIDSDLAKADSNHTVPEAGLGALVKRLQADGARAGERLTITHEGWLENGHFCSVYGSPPGEDFAYARTRVCFDPMAGVPMKVEGFDARGQLLERYAFSDLKPFASTETTFDPERGL